MPVRRNTKKSSRSGRPAATKKAARKSTGRLKAVKKKGAARKAKAPSRQPATAAAPAKVRATLAAAARTALSDCLDLKPGETVVIITDALRRDIGTTLWEVARELGGEAMLLEMMPRSRHGEEPPAPVAALMAMSSVVVCPTTMSLTHTAARRDACARGARIATLPGITADMMIRCMSADYQAIAARSRRLAEELQRGNEVHVTSPAGTDLTLIRGDRRPIPDTGLYHQPGEYGNLPAGETFFAPMEGSAQGTLVFEAAVAGIGKLKNRIQITVRDGLAVEITGGPEAEALNRLVDAVGTFGRNLAEFGMGTNDRAKITGLILEDEKVMGTAHVALGDNKSMGGNVAVPSHLDGLILRPTVRVDGRLIMQDGKLLL